MNESGKTEEDKLNDALTVYQEFESHMFKLLHCYEVLKHSQKWTVLRQELQSVGRNIKSAKKR